MSESNSRKRRSISRKRRFKITAIVTALLLTAGGGAAFAFWTSSGAGTGTGTTGTSTAFTVASTAATGAPLTPGGASQTVAFTVTNPGTGSANLSVVDVVVAGAGGAEWTTYPGCSALDYTVGTPTITYGEIAGGATVNGTVTLTMNNLGTSQDGCENATVPLYFTAS